MVLWLFSNQTSTNIVLRTHEPYKTAQGRLPAGMAPGTYNVFFRQPDGTEVEAGPFTVKPTVGRRERNALEDTVWVLEAYGEPGNLNDILADTEITAEFISAEGRVKGSGGCNWYEGGYEVTDSQLSIPWLVHTEMYCAEPEGVWGQEEQYFAAMRAAESYQIEGGKLIITYDGQLLIFHQH